MYFDLIKQNVKYITGEQFYAESWSIYECLVKGTDEFYYTLVCNGHEYAYTDEI